MKKLRNIWFVFVSMALVLGGLAAISGFAMKQSFTTVGANSSMTISGTSSLHDWSVTLEEFNCAMTAFFDSSLMKIENVAFRGRARTIKSDNNVMNRKIQESMLTDKYPEVRFIINSTRDVTMSNNRFSGVINGTLTIAGKSRTENIQFTGQMISENRIRITGSKKLKMTDFGISRPTAMMGAVRTGDEVTVSFNLVMAVN